MELLFFAECGMSAYYTIILCMICKASRVMELENNKLVRRLVDKNLGWLLYHFGACLILWQGIR